MKIIYGKAGTGTTNELLKMFIRDTETATFLSDEVGLNEIIDKINYLKSNLVDVVDLESKEIRTNMFTNCDSDYYSMILNAMGKSIYLNLHIPFKIKEPFKSFCIDMEHEYGLNIIMTDQLSADSEIKGIKILEYTDRIDY